MDHLMIGVTAVSFATFGSGTGSIWLDNVQCVGTETRLIDCPANAIGSHNCVHSEDAGVRCGTGVVGKLILTYFVSLHAPSDPALTQNDLYVHSFD